MWLSESTHTHTILSYSVFTNLVFNFPSDINIRSQMNTHTHTLWGFNVLNCCVGRSEMLMKQRGRKGNLTCERKRSRNDKSTGNIPFHQRKYSQNLQASTCYTRHHLFEIKHLNNHNTRRQAATWPINECVSHLNKEKNVNKMITCHHRHPCYAIKTALIFLVMSTDVQWGPLSSSRECFGLIRVLVF